MINLPRLVMNKINSYSLVVVSIYFIKDYVKLILPFIYFFIVKMIWQGSFMSVKNKRLIVQKLSGISILKRSLAEKNNYRVRNPVTPSRMTVRGQFPSKKMQRMIAWESQLERRACYLFEFSSNILSFKEQPERFSIPFKSEIKRYTPDFEIINQFGEISYCEIKPLNKLINLKDYFNHVSLYFLKQHIDFIVLTDKELINPIREHNLLILRQFQNLEITREDQLSLNEAYARNDCNSMTLKDLACFYEMGFIYSAIANGYLVCDLYAELTSNTSIFLNINKGNVYETCLFQYRSAPDF